MVRISSTKAIFALRDALLLNPENFKKLTLLHSDSELCDISYILQSLCKVNLLTQTNFERIIANHQHSISIVKGLSRLQYYNIAIF